MSDRGKTCVTCKFYKGAGFLDIRGPICTNSQLDDQAWTFYDEVSGEETHYERRHTTCSSARIYGCRGGRLWEPKNDRVKKAAEVVRLPPVRQEAIVYDPSAWTGRK